MHLEALIVKERNTQNSNYIQGYADTTKLLLKAGEIVSPTLAGYKVYDANKYDPPNLEGR